LSCWYILSNKKNKAHIRRIRAFSKKRLKPYLSTLSLVFGEVDAQVADGFLDFFNFSGDIPGEFLLVLDDLINEKLQFIDQIDRKYQGETVIRYELEHVFNIQ